MADNSNNLFAKSLSTGYHRGQPERGAGFRGTATEGNNVNKMQESDVQRKMASEATLRGDINGLEVPCLSNAEKSQKNCTRYAQ